MNNEQNKTNIVSVLMRQGFSLTEAIDYVKSFKNEAKAQRNEEENQ